MKPALNHTELPGLIEMAASYGVETIRVRRMMDWGNGIDYEKEGLSQEEYLAMVEKSREVARVKGIDLLYQSMYEHLDGSGNGRDNTLNPFSCIDPLYKLMIRGDGKVRFCPMHQFEHGDFTRQTYAEMERSGPIKEARRLLRQSV